MHMADALISPAVGGVMWAASAGTIAYCSKKVREEMDHRKVPLMGVLGAFIFAAQMINFTIPVTGSSGHLGGGMILSVLLGPYAAFLVMASVLMVQALFFADGGLLALGCNIFNLGVFPAFIAYPFIYRPIHGDKATPAKIAIAATIAAVVGLQLGAFAVVLQTTVSGISSLPFSTFVALMQPIHLGIGIVEGVVTASVISFVYTARPEIVPGSHTAVPAQGGAMKSILVTFVVVTIVTGGILSWVASKNPDGLEWSIEKITGKGEIEREKVGLYAALGSLQGKLSFLPDYSFKQPESLRTDSAAAKGDDGRLGTSISGIIGGVITLVIVFVIGCALKMRSRAEQDT